MIFTETREGRRFVGELPPGMPIATAIAGLITDYRITSGWMSGSGLVQDPIVRLPSSETGWGEPVVHAGRFVAVSMHAVVSEQKGQPDLSIRVLLYGEDGSVVGGQLVEAIAVSVELQCQTFDDITLRRYHDSDVGFARWLDVSVNNQDEVAESVRSGRAAMEAMPSRLLEPTEMPRLRVGDCLQHPRLGTCEVVAIVDDERITIRVDGGKLAQLHLGLLTLVATERKAGRVTYDVHIRRRNR